MQSQKEVSQFDDVDNLPTSLLISATYHSQKKKAVLKFYEPNHKKFFYGLIKLVINHTAYQSFHATN